MRYSGNGQDKAVKTVTLLANTLGLGHAMNRRLSMNHGHVMSRCPSGTALCGEVLLPA